MVNRINPPDLRALQQGDEDAWNAAFDWLWPTVFAVVLDAPGGTRGTGTNEIDLLRDAFGTPRVDALSRPELLRAWETNWPDDAIVVKVIYHRAAAELRVTGRWKAKSFQQTFSTDEGLNAALEKARAFIREQTVE